MGRAQARALAGGDGTIGGDCSLGGLTRRLAGSGDAAGVSRYAAREAAPSDMPRRFELTKTSQDVAADL
jgi:hypothetical protein